MRLPEHLEYMLRKMQDYFKNASRDELIKELIKRRRKQIMVHSCLYYRLNTSAIDDSTYDQFGKDLQILQKVFPHLAKEVEYHEYFEDYTETTSGFDLPIHLPETVEAALHLKYYAEKKNKTNSKKGGNVR
jgi:predicted CopG family antitoxin